MSLRELFNNLFWKSDKQYDFNLLEEDNRNNANYVSDESINLEEHISADINTNLDFMKMKYNSMINSDIVLREFTLNIHGRKYKAFLLFIDGMTDTNLVNDFILKPLMINNRSFQNQNIIENEIKDINSSIIVRKVKKFDLEKYLFDILLPQNNLKKLEKFEDIISGINSGNCALFIDTLPFAIDLDVKGFKQREINTPNNEVIIKGPQEGFVENLRTNTSILRRIINNENLIIENISVGKITKTKCAICYMKNITNDNLVAEVKYRVNNLKIDSLLSSGQLEQLIISENKIGIPEIISTERPDKVTKYILQGRVVLIVNGCPYALIMPAGLLDFMSSPEDTNLKPYFANFLRCIRLLAFAITMLLPGIYIAVTNFHQEILPTELLNSILSARQSVPFPVIFEIIIMEISFEPIREAGVRVPSRVGPTIGIVGALRLVQAAVSANIVSPILIIIVALTGIASFAIPDYSFGFHVRIFRFAFIFVGYVAGFLGISAGIYLYLCNVCSIKSFGIPFFIPVAPMANSKGASYLIPPLYKQEYRANYLSPKKEMKQEKISMKWKFR